MAPAVLEHPGAVGSTYEGGTDVDNSSKRRASVDRVDPERSWDAECCFRLDLTTSNYRQRGPILDSGRVPVRITRGHHRFRLGYNIEATIMEIAPAKDLVTITDEAAFDVAYGEQLDRCGLTRIGECLREVTANAAGRGLVLLCFEDVSRLGEFSCHRRTFARWWEAKTGEEVPELLEDATNNK
jgi:hypothetical protein